MSIEIVGKWYDGRSSRSIDAALRLNPDQSILVETGNGPVSARYDAVNISGRLGNAPRRIEFPGGGAFETTDNEAIDRLIARLRPSARPWMHRFESNWKLIGTAILVTMIIGWVTFRVGIPAASKLIANLIPPSVLSSIGEQTFAGINRIGLRRSELPQARRDAIVRVFATMVAESDLTGDDCRLEFRSADKTFGPNAFALPPCLIVMTDELVSVASHDDEIIAVLAHELGHIKHRHSLRRIVQDAFLAFILMMMTGDTTQVSATIATLPLVFLELGYARNFEREADRFAHAYMRLHAIELRRFPDILRRMEEWVVDRACEGQADCLDEIVESQSGRVLDYLATHPSTAERARMFTTGK